MKFLLLITIFFTGLSASECYQSYRYFDKHDVQSSFNKKVFKEEQIVDMTLHVRGIDQNNTRYHIMWLEDGVMDKSSLNQEGIHMPFVVKNSSKEGFVIDEVRSISRDRNLIKKLHAIIETFQFHDKNGLDYINGTKKMIEVNQTIDKDMVYVNYLSKKITDQLYYLKSDVTVHKKGKCLPLKSLIAEQSIKMVNGIDESMVVTDQRELNITESSNLLDSKHWFMSLSLNSDTWAFEKEKNLLSLDDARAMFGLKQYEMEQLLDKRDELTQWVQDNMDFLSKLDELLLSEKLNDKVSQKLFAKLGYLDSIESSRILTKVTLNQDIDEKERFRGLMALKNTSAPMDEELLDELITYGLDTGSEDFVQNAAGMLLGTLAKNRVERSPEEVTKINDVLYEAIISSGDKRVVMAAVGNMQEAVTEQVVEAVSSTLTSSNINHRDRQVTANAIGKLGKTTLVSDDFASLIQGENNSDTKAAIIKASAVSSDFQKNESLQKSLLGFAENKGSMKSNRLASLSALERGGYAQTKDEKQVIRQMMLGERDPDVIKALKRIYRR